MSDKRRINADEEGAEGAPEWMTTYSDLVTLLLTFFILLFSMASLDKIKFLRVAASLQKAFGHIGGGEMFLTNSGKNILTLVKENNSPNKSSLESPPDQQINDFITDVKQVIKQEHLNKDISIIDNQDTLILRVNSTILFDQGSAEIKAPGRLTLIKLGSLLQKLNREIFIQGHTDNYPINTTLFPTNWELSTKRATNIVLFLIANCRLDPAKLTPTGNAEFRPVAPNGTEAGRQQNRRIDILIIK
jgi:chemotaxis protein MotB